MVNRSLYAVVSAIALLVAATGYGQNLRLPAGTPVYGELDEQVTSRKKQTTVGDIVRAHAWRNVVVNGQTVVRAGAPLIVRVSHVKKARIAGRKGQLELEAVSVRAVDGSDVYLDGGYDKSGHGRKALSISLAAVVAWPLIFIKGKQAILEAGTVFDGAVQADTEVVAEGGRLPTLRLAADSELEVEVLYDDMDPEGKLEILPVRLRRCGGELSTAEVVTVNEEPIEPITVVYGNYPTEDGECLTVTATVDLKALGKHFRRGINRFEIESDGERAEVILDIEL